MSMPEFPKDIRLYNRPYWRRGDILAWIAKSAGEPPPAPTPDDVHLLNGPAVRKILGVSEMTLWRWRYPHGRPKAA
jgi:predicted DNA-binding transcriptional regulator AlpA